MEPGLSRDADLAAARARGRTGGRRPKLSPSQARHAQELYDARQHTVQQIADLLRVPRSTVYGHLDKTSTGRRVAATASTAPPTELQHGESPTAPQRGPSAA